MKNAAGKATNEENIFILVFSHRICFEPQTIKC